MRGWSPVAAAWLAAMLPPGLAAQTTDLRYLHAMDRALATAPDIRLALERHGDRGLREAGRAGLLQLTGGDLETRTELLAHGLATAEVDVCAAWARGALQPEEFPALLRELPDDALRHWAELTVRVLRLGLAAAASLPQRTAGDVTELVNRIARSLDPLGRRRLLQGFEILSAATDDEACEFARQLVRGTLALAPADREQWLPVIAWFEAAPYVAPQRE